MIRLMTALMMGLILCVGPAGAYEMRPSGSIGFTELGYDPQLTICDEDQPELCFYFYGFDGGFCEGGGDWDTSQFALFGELQEMVNADHDQSVAYLMMDCMSGDYFDPDNVFDDTPPVALCILREPLGKTFEEFEICAVATFNMKGFNDY